MSRSAPHSSQSAAPAEHSGKPVIGIALGSGAARGWGHIGILQGLAELGIEPRIVAGTSIGALVGAAYVCGKLDKLEEWALGLRRRDFFRYIDLHVPGQGLVRGGRIMEQLAQSIPDTDIETMPKPFAAVATDLATGREVWLREGRLLGAVRASIAVPGLFTPQRLGERWLVDGGMVNPVPVSLCRALGAHLVIGVNPFGDRMARFVARNGRGAEPLVADGPDTEAALAIAAAEESAREGRLRGRLKLRRGGKEPSPAKPPEAKPAKGPGMIEVLVGALNIMQDRITRSRMAGDPPDVLLAPRLSHISLLEFDRAEEAIAEGRACVKRMLPALQDAVGF